MTACLMCTVQYLLCAMYHNMHERLSVNAKSSHKTDCLVSSNVLIRVIPPLCTLVELLLSVYL